MSGIPTLWMKHLAVKRVEMQSKSKLFYLFHIFGDNGLAMCVVRTLPR